MRRVARTLIPVSLLAPALAVSALAAPAFAAPAVAAPAVAAPAFAAPTLPAPALAGGPVPTRMVSGAGWPTAAGAGGAYAYDTELAPPGAAIALASGSIGDRTWTVLVVRGLRPGHTYGTHLHRDACGPDPLAAGPHFQRVPGAPTDPDHANAVNEVWLDVRTNAAGAGVAYARNPWAYAAAVPGSVVLHAAPTSTHPTTPGVAGARVACVSLTARPATGAPPAPAPPAADRP
jgi:Cu-Zn family superoxide dismutase